MYNKEAIDIARQTLQVTNTQLARAKRLLETGRISKVEYAQFESQQAQDSYNVVQAENSYATSKMTLKRLLELGINNDISIADASFSDSQVLAPLPAAQDVYEYASTWLPDIKSNELNKDIYENDIKTAKAGYLPKINLSGNIGTGYTTAGTKGWGTQMKNGLNEIVGVSISVPIFDGNATKRAVAKAKLNALEYELQQESLLNTLSQTIENLYIDARGAQAKYTSGITQLEATQLTSDLVNRQFELGSVNTLEWLTAHNNLLNARLELLQSKYLAIMSAKSIEYYASQNISIP
jgi:outer membrane protein